MRVRLTFGSRAGEVLTFPVPAARAMLADGRAVSVEDPSSPAPHAPRVPDPSTLADRVSARVDKVAPRARRRQTR